MTRDETIAQIDELLERWEVLLAMNARQGSGTVALGATQVAT